jgi:hypothetical protein
MTIGARARALLLAAAVAALVHAPAAAEQKIALCHAGLIKLGSFDAHLKAIREARRYEPEQINDLIKKHRKYGDEFFSSQIVVQEEMSGSGTFDLRMFHGLSHAADYRNVTAWDCQREDFPIVYFVGFRVREIEGDTIFVSREKDIVNVISLSALDAKLEKRLKVQIFKGDKVLCRDIGKECDPGIFYERQ